MFRTTTTNLAVKGKQFRPYAKFGMPRRRRQNPVVRGFDTMKFQWRKWQGNALHDHVQFHSLGWKFRYGENQSIQNVRIQGMGADESNQPNSEKLWDVTWGELDHSRRDPYTYKMISDRKMVPKIMVPDWVKNNTKPDFQPYMSRTAVLDKEYQDGLDKHSKPIDVLDVHQAFRKQKRQELIEERQKEKK